MGSGHAALLLSLLASAAVLPGCTVEAEPPAVGGYATVYTDSVPADIYGYPHVYYDGGYAYLVGDQWYYPYAGRWVVLRSEPPALYQYRVGYARGRYYGGYRGGYYPHRNYVQPGVNVAPPARPSYYGRPPPAERVR